MIKIVEVGPRDGLQNEKSILSTEDKLKFISMLCETGLKTVEITSFVKPDAIPQMGDAVELFKAVKKNLGNKGINFPCLVPALKDKVRIRGYISTSFGCPYEGKMDVKKLLHVTERFFKLGAYEVSVGDTIGVATPSQVREYIKELKKNFPVEKLAMHFHDTRGMA